MHRRTPLLFRRTLHSIVIGGLLASAPRSSPTQSSSAQTPKRQLEHADADPWLAIEGARLSDAGGWLVYGLTVADGGDGAVVARSTVASDAPTEWRVSRGKGARVDRSEGYLVCTLVPERERLRAFELEQRVAKKKNKKKKPAEGLGVLDLASGELESIARVLSFEMPQDRGGWVAYRHLAPLKDAAGEEENETEEEEKEEESSEGGKKTTEVEAEVEAAEQTEPRAEFDHEKDKKEGTELVLHRLGSKYRASFDAVLEYEFSRDGRWLAFTTSTKDGSGDGVHIVELPTGAPAAEGAVPSELAKRTLLSGQGNYHSLTFDKGALITDPRVGEVGKHAGATQLAFLTNRDAWENEAPAWSLYRARLAPGNRATDDGARRVAALGSEGLPEGWAPGEHRGPQFSDDGQRLYFGAARAPRPDPEKPFEDESVTLDIWSWTDGRIQPEQLVELEEDRERTHLVVAHLDGDVQRLVPLGSESIPELRRADAVDAAGAEVARYALGMSSLPYERQRSWESYAPRDLYAIDLESGEPRLLLAGGRVSPRVSPGGEYAAWWDYDGETWWTARMDGGVPVDVGARMSHPMHHEPHDTPSPRRAEGSPGWTRGDRGLLVYDAYDLWQLDPAGSSDPVCLTEGLGRESNRRFRLIDLDREAKWHDPSEPWMLKALDLDSKAESLWRLKPPSPDGSGAGRLEKLLESDHHYDGLRRARDASRLIFTRESYTDFPDLWVADVSSPQTARRASWANPQQADFLWGHAERWKWTSLDGEPLEGLLYRPEGHNASEPAPLLVYFYERMSERLNHYQSPVPSRSTVRFPLYNSRGYLIFVPDIPYATGRPGPSALSAVVPGVLSLVEAGWADPDAIGVQGHSWGGYQIAYLVTQTDIFRAAVAGAPVSNMTSAYGGVRYQSGLSRMFQYEQTQSRIGGTLWDKLPAYLENSPLFYADRVRTPLLLLHNDRDGAVPWTQGIELFLALRRLEKPVWLLNYNGEKHGIAKYAHRRDYALRMQQFFDHYLRNSPAPPWLERGLPALEKGRTLGF